MFCMAALGSGSVEMRHVLGQGWPVCKAPALMKITAAVHVRVCGAAAAAAAAAAGTKCAHMEQLCTCASALKAAAALCSLSACMSSAWCTIMLIMVIPAPAQETAIRLEFDLYEMAALHPTSLVPAEPVPGFGLDRSPGTAHAHGANTPLDGRHGP